MNTKNSTSVAHEFIREVFSDCDGAMLVKNKKEGFLEILVFYNLIHAQYQKDFHYHSWEISTTTYRTGDCYALIFPAGKHHKRVKMFSEGTIIKDNKHQLETIQAEARIMLERDQVYR
jgi:hypothetical protein